MFGIKGAHALPEALDVSVMWDMAKEHPLELLLPWLLGGYILVFAAIPPAYFIYYRLVSVAKKAKARAKALRQQKQKSEAK